MTLTDATIPTVDATPSLAGLIRRWGPLVVILIGSVIAVRYQVLGRGAGIVGAWSSGMIVELLFCLLALQAAIGSIGERNDGLFRNAYRLLAVLIGVDAAYTFVFDWTIGRFAVLGLVHAALILLFFRFRPGHAAFIIAITFLVKIMAMTVIRETWYTWF